MIKYLTLITLVVFGMLVGCEPIKEGEDYNIERPTKLTDLVKEEFPPEVRFDAKEDEVFTYSVRASDPDAGDSLEITAVKLPPWLSISLVSSSPN